VIRLAPRTLFGRTLLVLGLGLLLAQIASQALNLFDRGGSVYRLAAYQVGARIAQAARILNRLPPRERSALVEEINGPHLSVGLRGSPLEVPAGYEEHDRYERAFAESLRRQLGNDWPMRVEITSEPRSRLAPGEGGAASQFEIWVARNFYFLLPGTFSLVAQVALEDGTTAVFFARIPQEPLSRLESLVPRLLLSLLIVFLLGATVVRMLTEPLKRLAGAAGDIGANPEGAPLEERGPEEVRHVIAAFNRMQARIRDYVLERTRMLGAISHDLKTPITRMRLRVELLPAPDLRAKFVRDLEEMESMVASTLEFFSGVDKEPRRQPVDVGALLESLCEDFRETGAAVSLSGAPLAPFSAQPQALRRCFGNLIENALCYGESANVEIEDDGASLRVRVRDHGPGIPQSELERVFEPYYRLDASRGRDRGGTGLGLSIARNIARWHGGDVRLRNAAEGAGLVAEVTLPRTASAAAN
jgi:signal transduction histidine kinase